MHYPIKLKCPYCQHEFTEVIRRFSFMDQWIVVPCNTVSNGCGKRFVVKYRAAPCIEIGKIEGE
jgi:hypothetical protein